MDLEKWAEKEIEIACKKENPDRTEGEWDYGCACYESALKAFKSLLEDEHSGFSIAITKSILNRLIDGKPLTPIEDTDDVWDRERADIFDECQVYQCTRMSSLFKYVYNDGRVKYMDVNRVIAYDIDSRDVPYHTGLADAFINELYPITMPYMPYDKYFKICFETFLTDKKHGDYDTKAILYLITPEGKAININRYFREPESDLEEKHTYYGWVEISKEEYEERKDRRIDNGRQIVND